MLGVNKVVLTAGVCVAPVGAAPVVPVVPVALVVGRVVGFCGVAWLAVVAVAAPLAFGGRTRVFVLRLPRRSAVTVGVSAVIAGVPESCARTATVGTLSSG